MVATPVSLSWFAAGAPARPGCFDFFNKEETGRCCSFEAVADPPRPHGAPSERFPTLISTLLPVALSPSTPASARPKRLAQWANQPSSKRSGITRAPSCSCVSRAGTSSPLRCSTCRKRLDLSKRAFPGCSLQVNPLNPPLHHPPSSRTASSPISGDCPPVATCG